MDYKIIILLVIIHILGCVYLYRILRDLRRDDYPDDYDWGDVILLLILCNFWPIFIPLRFLINCLTSQPPKYL